MGAERPRAAAPGRFIPSGVDAASWTDFEQRVQQRRFRALIEAAERAFTSGDHAGARGAIAEARELFPDSGEVALLAGRLALISTPLKEAERERSVFRSRTFKAASLLLAGVTSLMALDWTRSGSPADDPLAAVGTTGVPAADVAPSAEPPVAPPPMFIDAAPEAEAAAAEALPTVEATIPAPQRVADEAVQAANTSSEDPRPRAQPSLSARDTGLAPAPATETPNDFVVPSARAARNAVTTLPIAVPPVTPPTVVRGDVPDDYVAPRRPAATREAGAVASREPASSSPAPRPPAAAQPLASVVRQPGPVVEPLGTSSPGSSIPLTTAPPPPAAAAAAAAVIPPSEVNRVQSVLNQYASAYGTLDARAVSAVWPTVDQRALQRAFDDLSSQKVSFNTCDIQVRGTTAQASCRGTASYVGKVGSGTEPRTVKFELKRDGDAWRIEKADTRR